MTTQQFTPPQAALVAIDIAKNRHEILIEPGARNAAPSPERSEQSGGT